LKPEWWGSPLVQEENYQGKTVKREEEEEIIIIMNFYGSGLVACSNSELLLKIVLCISLDIWQNSLEG
jgi:hypothetical protein